MRSAPAERGVDEIDGLLIVEEGVNLAGAALREHTKARMTKLYREAMTITRATVRQADARDRRDR